VPEHIFLFSLRLPGNGGFDEMLADLTESVLRHCGFAPGAIAELGGEVTSAIPSPGARGELDVRFQAADGAIEIVVSRGAREIVRASRRLP
jgi:hypothetical protein